MTEKIYTKEEPFYASVVERYALTKPGSTRSIMHVVLDLEGSDISYEVGDCIGILAENDPGLVLRTLEVMSATGEETIIDKRSGESWQLAEWLGKKANLAAISKNLLKILAERQSDPKKKEALTALLTPELKDQLKLFLSHHELWDLLMAHQEAHFTPQELCDLMMPLLPRLYSIASSQKVAGNRVDLTVGMLEYDTNGQRRMGVCTHYLCERVAMHESLVPIYLQRHKGFTTPENPDTAMIMIGPGTGIAPFRAFMQERIAQQATGKHWLFFGERNRATDFLYEEYWLDLQKKGFLELDLAFSRDQHHKIYVQDRMRQKGQQLYDWLEKGACLYVCGDAERMAKDVEAALLEIIQTHSGGTEQQARDYIRNLRKENRYLRDVY